MKGHMDQSQFCDWVMSRIAKVGEGTERLELSQALAVLRDGNEDKKEEVFRQVEQIAGRGKRAPKDVGKLLGLFKRSSD
jgi:hypothetical protein